MLDRITVVVVVIAAAATAAADQKPSTRVAVTKIAPRVEGGKLWVKYEVTPKKVMTNEAILVRAACTKANLSTSMRDTGAWPVQNNTLDAKELDSPLGDTIASPTSCQLEFQLVADLLAMSGDYITTACWSNNKVSAGACKPPISESYAQALETVCGLTARWDSKAADRDVDLAKGLEDRVWNQQAKEFFTKLLKSPGAKRGSALQAEATKVGIRECALVKNLK